MPRGRVVACRASATAVNSMSITVFVLAFLAQASATPTAQAPSDAPASVSVVAQDAVSGAALEGVVITVATAPASSACVQVEHVRERARCSSSALLPGRYDVVGSAPDMLPAGSGPAFGELRRPVTLKAGENPVVLFTFRKPAAIRGQVLSPEGKPVRGATVEVVMTKSQFRGRPVVGAGAGSSTDAEGRFRIEKLVPGRYLVRARLPASDDAPSELRLCPWYDETVSEATPVVLESGDDVTIGITALGVPAVRCRRSSRGRRWGSGSGRNHHA